MQIDKKKPVFHQRSKHIDIKYHFIRSKLQLGNISVHHIASKENVADIFTKPVNKLKKKIQINSVINCEWLLSETGKSKPTQFLDF